MRRGQRWVVWGVGILVGLGILGVEGGSAGEGGYADDTVPPTVFQAAGPTVEAIQGTVDQFRAALGEPNNANAPGPLASGRREINWDGGGSAETAVTGTPFDGFLVNRGALFITPGSGFVQAPLPGLVETFDNPTYDAIFQTLSPLRLFTLIGSPITEVYFFVPGGGNIPATTTGFGAIFTDVDQPDGSPPDYGERRAGTWIRYFDVHGQQLFSSAVPASPGDGCLSFFGLVFDEARIARVQITSGDAAPGPDDEATHDIVVMDDFLYGEPLPLP
jgi:hypothetical protein